MTEALRPPLAARFGHFARALPPQAWVGGALVGSFVLMAIFADHIAPFDPNASNIKLRLKPPGTEGHWLGIDTQGRDVLSRTIHGARASLITGTMPVAISAAIAVPLGLAAAWFDRAGALVMRMMDVLFAFPMVLLAILLAAILGPGLPNLIIAMVLVLLPFNTRVAYTEALSHREAPWVEAARALGTPVPRILLREVLPHVLAATIVYSMTIIGTIIITAAGLSFLGLGIQPPTPDWGLMTGEGRTVLNRAPHVATVPGAAIFLLVTGFNLLGDGLRDALNPGRQR
ncbi:ABC transporter permease [Primorskyibacter flagellatus]|uniref:ABC transporter permease n=1 Tax=Primorskyibacter flagellatus TaxID=1387277 RepID=A0A916ZW36_9RHOB|nr:ABC transporter permease [Primorskyibacter flagellatus]GGE15538.1 ABC transporter permease [Primorskyibacter flagellatus]